MVNSDNPSTDRVTLQSRYSRHEASQKPQSSSEYHVVNNFFQQDFPIDKHTNRSVSPRSTLRWKPHRKILLHTPTHANLQFDAVIHVPARQALFGNTPPLASSSTADEPAQPLHEPRRHRNNPPFPLFFSDDYF